MGQQQAAGVSTQSPGEFFFWFSFFLTSHAPAGWLPTLLYLRYLRLRKRKKKKTHNREREREGGQYRSRVVQSRLPFPTSLPVLPSSPAAAAAALRTTRSDDEIWAGQSKHSHADWPRRSNLPCGRYAYFPQRSRSLFFFFFFCGRGAAVSALRTALRVRQSRIRTRNPPPPVAAPTGSRATQHDASRRAQSGAAEVQSRHPRRSTLHTCAHLPTAEKPAAPAPPGQLPSQLSSGRHLCLCLCLCLRCVCVCGCGCGCGCG